MAALICSMPCSLRARRYARIHPYIHTFKLTRMRAYVHAYPGRSRRSDSRMAAPFCVFYCHSAKATRFITLAFVSTCLCEACAQRPGLPRACHSAHTPEQGESLTSPALHACGSARPFRVCCWLSSQQLVVLRKRLKASPATTLRGGECCTLKRKPVK
jgi:hypothetical protein